MDWKKIQFQILADSLIFLFRYFGGGNGFAQTAGMLAIKSFGHRRTEGT